MTGSHLSLILLPTLRCNADCEYCFENKTSDTLSIDRLTLLASRFLDHMEENDIRELTIYWQGGEVLTIAPDFYMRARDVIDREARSRTKTVKHRIQSNLIGYGKKWNGVIAEMFDNRLGSSLDFPNLYRKVRGGSPASFNRMWIRKFREARDSGIDVSVISIPNEETLARGAEAFYTYYADEVGLRSFQINTPFPGGAPHASKMRLPLPTDRLASFFLDLLNIWLERGYEQGIRIGPFDELIDYFLTGNPGLPCIWHNSCAGEFVCIDPRGFVSQCDCWVASYPAFRFGNIFEAASLTEILRSDARRRIKERPIRLIQLGECIDCTYLSVCHGGCPIRAYSVHSKLEAKDPYCETYQALFKSLDNIAVKIARSRSAC